MLSAERRNLILREAQEKKKVFVNDLSRRFEVSEEIRSHLQTIWGARIFHPVALLKLMFLWT